MLSEWHVFSWEGDVAVMLLNRPVRAVSLGVVALGVMVAWSSGASAGTIELIHGGNDGMRIFFEVADTNASPFQGGNYDIGETAGWEGVGFGSASDQSFPVGDANTVAFPRTNILSAGFSVLSFPRIEIYFQDASQWSSTWNGLQGTTLTLNIKLTNAGGITILDTSFSGETNWVYPIPVPSSGSTALVTLVLLLLMMLGLPSLALIAERQQH